VFFKSGKRLLCACACVRVREKKREKDVAGVLVELEASSARSTAHPLLYQTHKTLENSSATTKSKNFVAEERTNSRERVGARASERASERHSRRPRWRERDTEEREDPWKQRVTGSPLQRVARPDRIRFFSESQRYESTT
jgi:hypothetical protein